ncbi:TPA: hypothetical protein ACGF1T_002926 [Vibrio cholerae]|nr:hypothetical protein [Vibrio cholerae]EGR0600830.1 hypothetical protein [Vibrio cholerae]
MKKALLITAIFFSTNTVANTIQIEMETFCSMYESLLASTGLMEAAEMAELDKQLSGYNSTKANISQIISATEKQWINECIGAKRIGIPESDIITSSDQFTDENFQLTDEQTKRLVVLAAEWAQRKGFLLDTADIDNQIKQLQNEIRAK